IENSLLDWRQYFEPLRVQQRATVFVTPAGARLWVSAERLPLLLTLFPGATLEPPITAAGPAASQTWQPEDALVELLRGRLECLGPVTEIALAGSLQLPLTDVRVALRALENQGLAMQGRFSPNPEANESEWCERGRLECLGPVTEIALAGSLQLPLTDVRVALRALENQGFAMQGRFSPNLEENESEWCERGLLARIHRYTLKQLRERVQPVSAAD